MFTALTFKKKKERKTLHTPTSFGTLAKIKIKNKKKANRIQLVYTSIYI